MLSLMMECSSASASSPMAAIHQEALPHEHVTQHVTNFCIEEILKPNFGKTVSKRRQSAFTRCDAGKRDGTELSGVIPGHVTPGHLSLDTKCFVYPVSGKIQTPVTSPPGTDAAAGARKDEPEEKRRGSPERSDPKEGHGKDVDVLWPAWVYCTRYSDRPSSGRKARSRYIKYICVSACVCACVRVCVRVCVCM